MQLGRSITVPNKRKASENAGLSLLMKRAALTLFVAFASYAACLAGTTGVVSGYVRDAMGRPVAKALVIARSPSQTCTTSTDKRGFFVCLTLPPDVYNVHAEKFGFAAFATAVRIDSDQTTFLHFRLSVFRGCPRFTQTPLLAEPFTSLDVRWMERYPPNLGPPIALPMASIPSQFRCL